jgi:hypothetical protein
MICGNQQNCKNKWILWWQCTVHVLLWLHRWGGKALAKRVEAPISLSYKQLFFCNYVGNLTGIYDVNYFGKITISSIGKDKIDAGLRSLKKNKVAKPVPESLAFIGFWKLDFYF